jgi:hypothetical protein
MKWRPTVAEQIPFWMSEYEQRCEKRDMAAYQALGALTQAIVLCEQGDAKSALAFLVAARDRYEARNRELQAVKLSHKKGATRHDAEPTYRPAA